MSFIEPLFLLGLLAALLPLLIHLINRKKAVKRHFGPMRFLLESHQKKAPGFKTRQVLLMSVRILLIALLAFALAKPFFLSDTGLTSSERLPSATAIVIDNSFSMHPHWTATQEAIEKELSTLRTWDEVVIITTNPAEGIEENHKLSDDQGAARKYAESVKLSKEKGNIAKAIERAEKVLSSSELPNHRIAVLSDFARGGFPLNAAPAQAISLPVDEYIFDSGSIENVALSSITYEQEGDPRDNMWVIRASFQNFGEKERKEKIELGIAGKVIAGAEITIPAKSSKTHVFRHVMEGDGSVKAFVQLANSDNIPTDDLRHFVFILRDKIRVLVVNGEPNSVIYKDETFFLERALNPMGDTESNISVTVTTREGLETTPLNDYDAIAMANVSKVSPASGKRLQKYVEKGGGLFMAMGDRVEKDVYNQNLAGLLPKPLRGLKRLALRNDPDAPVKITHIGAADMRHPIFRVFELPGGTTIRNVEVYSYMLLEPSPPEQSKTILSFKNNAPALLERSVGRGNVVMLTTSVDDEWTDFPFRTAFLPLMRRISQHLAKRSNSFDRKAIVVGERIELEVGSLVKERLIVKTPTNKRLVLEPVDSKVNLDIREIGVYDFWAEDDKEDHNQLPSLSFAANFDLEESDLRKVKSTTIEQWTNAKEAEKSSQKGSERRVNIWPWLLFVVTMLLLLETMISTRKSVLLRLWGKVFAKGKFSQNL